MNEIIVRETAGAVQDDPRVPVAQLYRKRLAASKVLPSLHEELIGYLAYRRPAGSYLLAALSNDLQRTVALATTTEQAHLSGLVTFLVWDTPAGAWGSPDKVQTWLSGRTS